MWTGSARSATCVLSAAVLLAGCSAAPHEPAPESPAAAQAPRLSAWEPCPVDDPGDDPAGVECATLAVPYDYTRPDGQRFTIPVSRIPSTAATPRLLVMNPGGPGVSGVADLRSDPDYYKKFTDVYTVVSFDPRGMGGSSPALSCLDEGQQMAMLNQPSVPRSEAEDQRRQELSAGIGAACERRFGSALGHVGTENVARDMDAIRAAMGFDKINYLGYSYGTFLGAMYLQMFPERTGRVVLDSVMAPELDYREVRHGQAQGMQASVTAFAEDCLRRSDCPLTGPAANAVQTIVDLINRLDATAHREPDGRELSGSRMLALVESAQYMPESGWPALRSTLSDALANRWSKVVEAAYSPDLMVNPADSQYLSVVCTDFATERDPQAPGRLAPLWAAESPISGANRAWSLAPCETWPVDPVRRPGPVKPEGGGPVLILSTTGDPATPVEWARSLHRQISGSSLVIAPGPGHLASEQNSCADEMLIAFLLHGTTPPAQLFSCPANP